MTETLLGAVPSRAAAISSLSVYRAVWRWHFYAGLLALPFLIILAVTGAAYLYKDEIDNFVYRDLKHVEVQLAERAAPSALIDAALAAYPGTAVKYLPPADPEASAEITVKTGRDKVSVFVDPYTGRVLGDIPDKGSVMWVVRQLHSLAWFGPVANGIIEIVGGWTILLVGTGIFLWWPRKREGGAEGGVVTVRGTRRQRVFWRDLHAVTGIFVGAFIVFLAVTGMPWSVFWGSYVNQWANSSNYGYPSGVRTDVPMSDEHLAHMSATSWSLEQARMPESIPVGGGSIGLDSAVAIFDRLGMAPGYAVSLPGGPTGVYSASAYPDELSLQRVVHLDQYTGKPLIDMSYADYGPFGKALEWGVNVHMGQEFGLANQILMLLVCMAIVLLSVSAGIMWWKRRPGRSLGVPPLPSDRSVLRGVLAILMIGGVLFPLVGVSLVVMAILDYLLVAGRQRLRTV
ncbi:sulfite reductase [Skermanella aerolata]|uniref:Sulfite reductase n=1 Tax=Skermanella aerolata TaxID=393310 RepID=A0A512DZF6_9PROT|nr:PepSY domain-containing protein [Skermanella aerolata]KJB91040.1 propeptide, pepSY amd peptidase M4 [Skermanella aerolata KACC 11604]GEO41866.1 sulfite reductase [Skermanella aerolata]